MILQSLGEGGIHARGGEFVSCTDDENKRNLSKNSSLVLLFFKAKYKINIELLGHNINHCTHRAIVPQRQAVYVVIME